MGITTYLFHRSDNLEKQKFNMFFLDMGENIHFHYRDFRLELSVEEFVELAELFNRYAREVLAEIDNGYRDGVLANTNEAGTLKTFWDKDKPLKNPVKYHEQQLAIEETKDGYHLHIRNYKILLFKESFLNLAKAMAPILPQLQSGRLNRDPFILLEQNELQPQLISRTQTPHTEEILVGVEKTYRNKAGQVLKAIGFSELIETDSDHVYTRGDITVKVVSLEYSQGGDVVPPVAADSPVRLASYLSCYGSSLTPERLNELKMKILSLLKMAENGEIPFFRLENLFINVKSRNPMVDMFSQEDSGDVGKEIEKFSRLLAKHKLFFIKPKKEYLPVAQQQAVGDRFFDFVMEKLALHECVRRIYVLGSSTYHGLGQYSVPFVHFDWVKLNSDFDIYIEIDPEWEGELPTEWQKKFYWERNGSDYYHFGELGDGSLTDIAQQYPQLRFYDHLIEGYLFDPKMGNKKKKDNWFKEIKAQCIFSRDRVAQWVAENYDISPVETERFSVASFNRVYHIQSPKNDFVLKIYDSKHLSSKNLRKISYEIKVLDSLKESGLEVALPVKNRQGKYISSKGKEKAAVFTFVPGKYVANPSSEQVQQAGRLLARFHMEAKKCKTKLAKNYDNKETIIYWLKAWQEYHDKNVVGTNVAVNIFKYIKILKDHKEYPTHCHGDLSLINYLFDGNNCYLIDFQSIAYGPALIDLANAMVEFSARKKLFLFQNLDDFCLGYESVRELGRVEKNALTDMLIIQIIARQAKLIRLHYGGFGYELKGERLLGLREGLVKLI